MFIKKLTRQGNSSALVIDKPILDLLDITRDTSLKVTIQGRQLIIEPLSEEEVNARFEKSMKQIGSKNARGFRRLAQ